MASFYGHFTFSAVLAVGTTAAAAMWLQFDWGATFIVAALTIVGGLAPDLDSASGIPVRELFGMASIVGPLIIGPRLQQELGLAADQQLALLLFLYLFIRYGLIKIFKKFTVHRGMFHSIPAMLILGLIVFTGTSHPGSVQETMVKRLTFSIVAMIGFMGHLVLDEIYSINLDGLAISVNQFSGTAVKFIGPSMPANLFCYSLLGLLGFGTFQDTKDQINVVKDAFTTIQSRMLAGPRIPNWFETKDGKDNQQPAQNGQASREMGPMPKAATLNTPVAANR